MIGAAEATCPHVPTSRVGHPPETAAFGAFRVDLFELYALSKTLDLPPDATRQQLLDAMRDSIVGKSAYFGRFRQ